VDDHLDPITSGGDLPRHGRAVVGRGVIDDEHADVNAVLVVESLLTAASRKWP
jgi:hypothetical protein